MSDGAKVSESLYATRDLYLYRLADSDLKAEYRWYMSLYMSDDATAARASMAEMDALIKLGELVDKPQAKRMALVERAAEEAKIAQREHAAEKARSEAGSLRGCGSGARQAVRAAARRGGERRMRAASAARRVTRSERLRSGCRIRRSCGWW